MKDEKLLKWAIVIFGITAVLTIVDIILKLVEFFS